MKNSILIFFLLLTANSQLFSQAPEIEWQNTIGGTLFDELTSICQTSVNGYILGGSSYSHSSDDKTEDRIGDDDYWIVKLNSEGTIEWDETMGGTGLDNVYAI